MRIGVYRHPLPLFLVLSFRPSLSLSLSWLLLERALIPIHNNRIELRVAPLLALKTPDFLM